MRGWDNASVEILKARAARGEFATNIAIAMNTSKQSVLHVCAHRGIEVNAHTPAEAAQMLEKTRERERRKNVRRRLHAPPPVVPTRQVGASKTAPAVRNQRGSIGNPTKSELYAMYHQAVLNTPGSHL